MGFEVRDTEVDIETLGGLLKRVDDQGLLSREEETESVVVQVRVNSEIWVLKDDDGGLQGRLAELVCVTKELLDGEALVQGIGRCDHPVDF